MAVTVPCPICRTPAPFDAARNPWRPFCSERCKRIDLGAWASGDYAVQSSPKDVEEAEALVQAKLQAIARDTSKP
jgi:endogenous inhibitor of DNA gyrase (YacG/DUF329 family)